MEPDGNDLVGVRYEDGVRQDAGPRDYTGEILSAPAVAVGLCVPVRDEEFYRSLFERHGFHITGVVRCYRVTVLRFEKGAGG